MLYEKRVKSLIFVFIFLSILDIFTTYTGVTHFNLQETNPVVLQTFSYPLYLFVILKIFAILFPAYIFNKYRKFKFTYYTLIVVNFILLIVQLNNILVMVLQWRYTMI